MCSRFWAAGSRGAVALGAAIALAIALAAPRAATEAVSEPEPEPSARAEPAEPTAAAPVVPEPGPEEPAPEEPPAAQPAPPEPPPGVRIEEPGLPVPTRPNGGWEAALQRAIPAVVSLRVTIPRGFDTEHATTSVATGFVVDAERGLILTNRHVVTPGPVVAEAVFLDHEEVEVEPVYRDPVHDFGFFRYDPDDVEFMEPRELALAPERARVGAEIRVIGNDAGEKLSILSGTLARLDRRAPDYGQGRYNDFNTFYYQAASSTSGGSSGSPVINVEGEAIALNAGGRSRAASSYYLPLQRVERALSLLQEGEPVPRGTLQAVFERRSYAELRRLGLRSETEAAVRDAFPDARGMLVVEEVVPGGPAHGALEPGDILVRAGGELVREFLPLETRLDAHVGETVALEVERGGTPIRVTLTVGDLHAVTPSAYLEMGGAVLNPLSYQQARGHGVPVRGVYVAVPGYALGQARIPRGAVITAFGGMPTETLDDFEARAAKLAHGERALARYYRLEDPGNEVAALVRADRRFFPMQRCVRDDATGSWPCRASASPPPAEPPRPVTLQIPEAGDALTDALARSIAIVDFRIPYRLDGVYGDRFTGAGLVVDAERGLVVVDRDTVPISLGEATVTFAGSVELPAEVVALHPEHNLAVVRYDPALLSGGAVRAAELREEPLEPGDEVWLAGMTRTQQLVTQRTRVSRVDAISLPPPHPPRFRSTNLEGIAVSPTLTTIGGVLADDEGRVLALWAAFSADARNGPRSFTAGIPADLVRDLVEPLRNGRDFVWHMLGAELERVTLADARHRGLSEETAERLAEHDPQGQRVLAVSRLTAGTAAARQLETGDLLLAIDGRSVTRFREVEIGCGDAEQVTVRVLRDGAEREIEVPAIRLDGHGTRRAVSWAGALLQEPPRAVAAQRGARPQGVYISWTWYGSPAHRYGLTTTHRVTRVNGEPTPDLDAFLDAVRGTPGRGSVRLRSLDLEGKVHVGTLRLDLRFWPTWELRRGPEGWKRFEQTPPQAVEAVAGDPASAS